MPHRHLSLLTSALATMVALVMFGASTAHAQIPPPCGGPDLTIKNGTGCDIHLCLKGYNAVDCWDVPAGDGIVVPVPVGFEPVGAVNTGDNTTYEFLTPSPDPSAAWWVPNIRMSGCCVDVFYDPTNCVIWVLDTSSPPPCQ